VEKTARERGQRAKQQDARCANKHARQHGRIRRSSGNRRKRDREVLASRSSRGDNSKESLRSESWWRLESKSRNRPGNHPVSHGASSPEVGRHGTI
jgi:hypothetical protein